MTRYRVHPAAREELDEAAALCEGERTGLGSELIAEYERKLEQALRFPRSGPAWLGLEPGLEVRQFVFARFPFTLVVGNVSTYRARPRCSPSPISGVALDTGASASDRNLSAAATTGRHGVQKQATAT